MSSEQAALERLKAENERLRAECSDMMALNMDLREQLEELRVPRRDPRIHRPPEMEEPQ